MEVIAYKRMWTCLGYVFYIITGFLMTMAEISMGLSLFKSGESAPFGVWFLMFLLGPFSLVVALVLLIRKIRTPYMMILYNEISQYFEINTYNKLKVLYLSEISRVQRGWVYKAPVRWVEVILENKKIVKIYGVLEPATVVKRMNAIINLERSRKTYRGGYD